MPPRLQRVGWTAWRYGLTARCGPGDIMKMDSWGTIRSLWIDLSQSRWRTPPNALDKPSAMPRRLRQVGRISPWWQMPMGWCGHGAIPPMEPWETGHVQIVMGLV